MPDVNVGVAWVEQQKLFYCGPAVIEMVLATLHVNRPVAPPTWQDQIWSDVELHTGAKRPSAAPSTPTAPAFANQKCEVCTGQWKCWSTTPGVLEYLINQYQSTAVFTITLHASQKSATATVLDTIDAQLPSIALVHGWQHWIVVEGYRFGEANPTAVGARAINGVFIRDPKSSQSSVHYITWSKWTGSYLDVVPCGDYETKFVILGGTRLAPPPPPPPRMPTNIRIIDDPEPPQRLSVRVLEPLITAADAIQSARQAALELSASSRLGPALDGASAEAAILVQRLDRFDSYYYIVSLTTAGRETARVIVDAVDGRYSEVLAIEAKGQQLPPYLPVTDARARIATLGASLTPQFRFQVRAVAVGSHPVAVWKPCLQSSSPFMPFYQHSIGDALVYYRFDGERFDELTEGPA